ncbi:MAG: hypothetical protein QOJ72_2580 [Nocardioidaceae bacterium]|nr:hypothetical protein [Nocardioidaceae bacterium]
MRWLRYVLVLVALTALSACHVDRPSQHDLSPGVDPAGGVSPTLPDGWRWESYRDVEVGVPADWGWGSSDQLLGQWCVGNGKHPKPMVGRPGISTLVGCPPAKRGEADPETLISNTGMVVAFEDATRKIPRGGDRQIITYGDVTVVVQAPESLRTRIIATIHLVKIDHQGCPTSDPISWHFVRRPSQARDVARLRDVTALSVCRYGGFLVSSLRYGGPRAARIVRQIAAAPKGGGPNTPETCTEKYGDEVIVLRITSATGRSQIYARYSGCDHNGFDDGITVRTLTRAPMQALIAGPNAPTSWDGVLDPILSRKGRR